MLIAVANDIPSTASVPAAEGSRVVGIHPPHSAVSSLVVCGVSGPLAPHRRSLNILLLLLLDPLVVSPP